MAKIYVSSTYSDLKSFRTRVREAIRRRGHEDMAMELYGARDERPIEKCLLDVEQCDLFIGVVAWRYGFIPPGYTHSITELEYLKSVACNKSRLLFLLNEEASWPVPMIEVDKSAEIKALRKKMSEDRIVGVFDNEDQLSEKVTNALVEWEGKSGLGKRVGKTATFIEGNIVGGDVISINSARDVKVSRKG